MNKILNWLISRPERFFIAALVVFALIVLSLDYVFKFNTSDDWKGVLTEAHGMLLDIIVFGILLSIYEKIRIIEEKRKEEYISTKNKIDRYMEEIDDFRGWNDQESTFRIIGNIKRLNKLGITKFDFSGCFLEDADFSDLNLTDSTFSGNNLTNVKFHSTNLENVFFSNVTLEKSSFKLCNLNGVTFHTTKFIDCMLLHSSVHAISFPVTDLKGLLIDNTIIEQLQISIKGEENENEYYYFVDKQETFQEYVSDRKNNLTLNQNCWKIKTNENSLQSKKIKKQISSMIPPA